MGRESSGPMLDDSGEAVVEQPKDRVPKRGSCEGGEVEANASEGLGRICALLDEVCQEGTLLRREDGNRNGGVSCERTAGTNAGRRGGEASAPAPAVAMR